MLSQIPITINLAARITTLRHPNSLDVQLLRKELLRKELDSFGNPSESAGAPTMGGMGMLRTEDEAEFNYVPVAGAGRMQVLGGLASPADMNDSGASLLTEKSITVRIECTLDPSDKDFWIADKGDLIIADMGMGVLLTYEAVTLSSKVLIPPYTRSLILNPRDDLNYIPNL